MNQPGISSASETLVISGDEVATYLTQIGISQLQLARALDAGEVGANNVDEFHPKTAAGTVRWLDTVGQLRRGLGTENDWQLNDPLNSPRIVRPDRVITLMAVGGSADTGLMEGNPQANRRKGAATRDAVAAGQTSIDISISTTADPESIGKAAGTWVLLYHRAKEPNMLRAELSLPSGIRDGQFTGWFFRILLPHKQYDPATTMLPKDAGGSDVSFDISRTG